MARINNYFSTLFAMGFIICIPTGVILVILILILGPSMNKTILSWMAFVAYCLIFFGGIFFITHFIFRIIEGKDNTDLESDILDEGLFD